MGRFAALALILALGACEPLSVWVAGAIGAAVTPIVQPQVDRGLNVIGAQWIDPGGTGALK